MTSQRNRWRTIDSFIFFEGDEDMGDDYIMNYVPLDLLGIEDKKNDAKDTDYYDYMSHAWILMIIF